MAARCVANDRHVFSSAKRHRNIAGSFNARLGVRCPCRHGSVNMAGMNLPPPNGDLSCIPSDRTKTGASAIRNRLTTAHLLLWLTTSAVVFALLMSGNGPLDVPAHLASLEARVLWSLVWFTAAPFLGAALAGAVLALW